MNNFAALYKVYMRNMRFSKADSKKNKIKIVGYCFLALIACGIIAFACFIAFLLSHVTYANGALENFVSFFMFITQVMTLIFGSISLISVVFKSRDNELLLGMPIKPIEIFLAKMTTVFTTNLLLPTIFLLPIFITIGVTTGMGVGFYFLMIIAIFFTPQIPLIFATLISIPVLFISRYLKRNAVLSLLLAILACVAFFAIYLSIIFAATSSSNISIDDPEFILQNIIKPMKSISYIIYPNLFIARAMIGIDPGSNIGIYIAIMLAAFAIVIGLAYLTYNKVAASTLESRAATNKHGKTRANISSTTLTLIGNDLRNLLGQTGLMFSSIIGLLMAPIMAIVTGMVAKEINSVIFIALLCVGGMNYFATIGVSRDNNTFFISKFLPITPKQYVGAKLIIANSYVILTSTLLAVTLLAFKFVFYEVLLLFVVMLIYGMGNSAFSLRRDLSKPVLNWTNIKEITNNRLAVMLPILIAFVLGFGTLLLQILFSTLQLSMNTIIYLPFAILLAISAAFALVSYYMLYKDTEHFYNRIEASNG